MWEHTDTPQIDELAFQFLCECKAIRVKLRVPRLIHDRHHRNLKTFDRPPEPRAHAATAEDQCRDHRSYPTPTPALPRGRHNRNGIRWHLDCLRPKLLWHGQSANLPKRARQLAPALVADARLLVQRAEHELLDLLGHFRSRCCAGAPAPRSEPRTQSPRRASPEKARDPPASRRAPRQPPTRRSARQRPDLVPALETCTPPYRAWRSPSSASARRQTSPDRSRGSARRLRSGSHCPA